MNRITDKHGRECIAVLLPIEPTPELLSPFKNVAIEEGRGGIPDFLDAWSDLLNIAERYDAAIGEADADGREWVLVPREATELVEALRMAVAADTAEDWSRAVDYARAALAKANGGWNG